MIAKPYIALEHYKILFDWWNGHADWSPLPQECLPKTGSIVFDGDTPICAGFLYRSDSAFVMFEQIISDPKSHHLIRSRALDILIKDILSKTKKGEVVLTWVKNKRLLERYKAHGFSVGDTGMFGLVKSGG
jgi:hypothetical protein